MLCTGTTAAAISIIEGANAPVVELVRLDPDYAAELWRRAEAFMECVENLTPPVVLAPVAAPVKATVIRDMSQSNSWCDAAATWLEHFPSAKKAASAEKLLKDLVTGETAEAFGAGVRIKRDRAGRLSVRKDAA